MSLPSRPPVANPRFDFAAPVPPLEELGGVHFIAIGGAGAEIGIGVWAQSDRESLLVGGERVVE